MLGIFFIISLAVYLFIELKACFILKNDLIKPVELNREGHTYNVCARAVKLNALSIIVMQIGYLGCAWPYLFIQNVDKNAYIGGIVIFGIFPVLLLGYACYQCFKNTQGHIKISTEEIEYKRRKSFSVKINDIKKITYPGIGSYQIHLKEKGTRPLHINLNGFHKKIEIQSLMKQLRDHSAEVSGRDKKLAHRLSPWRLEMILGKYYPALYKIVITLLLLYTSYCCIDYDFFRKDYVAQYNALNTDSSQSENAWTHYVQAAVDYIKLEEGLQEIMDDRLCSGERELTEDQKDVLKRWFDDNTSSWESLKKAASINYCNATYKHISLSASTDQDDFSNPSDTGYGLLKNLYHNANAGRLVGVLDIDWFDLFQMQLMSSKHFVNGKSIMDQLVSYAMLARSVKLLSKQDSYKFEDLEKVRNILNEHFPSGIPPLNIEGEIFISCSSFNDMINEVEIPTQTPLNPMFLALGSMTSTEKYARNHYTIILKQAQNGIETESDDLSILSFPIIRKMLFSIVDPSIAKIYKISQRADTYLSAAYTILDLEEYRLMQECYPEGISQLNDIGLTSQLPSDPYTDDKIIYFINEQRAALYSVGQNGVDDGGYKDDEERDDIIFWERNFKGVSEIEGATGLPG